MNTWIVAILAAVFLFGCGAMWLNLYGEKDAFDKVDFQQVHEAVLYAAASYQEDDKIKETYGEENLTITTLEDSELKFFVLTYPEKKVHWISVRGTATIANAKVDAEYLKEKDPVLGIYLHEGFGESAEAAYAVIKPGLVEGYTVNVTGHSLGGAVAAILMMYLDVDGFALNKKCYTFGQPKVTNKEGVARFKHMPMVRVVDNEDIVPLVPPLTLLSARHGAYRHFGEEVILKGNGHFLYLPEHDADRLIVSSTWLNLFHESVEDHYIANYLANIEPLLEGGK